MTISPLSESPLDALTAKQREVLDLLIQHKTSKEISRILGISPYTVDQRILLARGKLQVASRSEVAQAYRLLLERTAAAGLSGKPVYGSPDIAISNNPTHKEEEGGDGVQVPTEDDSVDGDRADVATVTPRGEGYHRVLPEMFDGPYGTLMRLGVTALIAMVLILTVLGGLTMFSQLSRIVDR
jgi:DNA-binding CsgD family transcriptional regulator